MHLPSATRRRIAPLPSEVLVYPWRFCLGDYVYIRGWPSESTYQVIGGELWCNFPHLHVSDGNNGMWRIPQLHCSSKTISYKKS